VSQGASEPAFADAARPGDDEIAAGADPFAGGELAEESTIEAAGGTIVDILDAGGLAKARDSCARLEAFLASQRGLVFEQQGEPLRVFEGARFGIVIEFLEALCHAMQAERMQPASTTGWTAGFGAEWAFAHAPVSLSLEYDYLDFRSAQVPFISAIVPGQVFPINISQKIHTVLFGANLRFGGGSGF
jgi:hypothetical protein